MPTRRVMVPLSLFLDDERFYFRLSTRVHCHIFLQNLASGAVVPQIGQVFVMLTGSAPPIVAVWPCRVTLRLFSFQSSSIVSRRAAAATPARIANGVHQGALLGPGGLE